MRTPTYCNRVALWRSTKQGPVLMRLLTVCLPLSDTLSLTARFAVSLFQLSPGYQSPGLLFWHLQRANGFDATCHGSVMGPKRPPEFQTQRRRIAFRLLRPDCRRRRPYGVPWAVSHFPYALSGLYALFGTRLKCSLTMFYQRTPSFAYPIAKAPASNTGAFLCERLTDFRLLLRTRMSSF